MTKKVDVPNTHHCIKGLWDKLTPMGKRIYNHTQELSQRLMVHPRTSLPAVEWKTISHNLGLEAAWKAEDLMKEFPITELLDKR